MFVVTLVLSEVIRHSLQMCSSAHFVKKNAANQCHSAKTVNYTELADCVISPKINNMVVDTSELSLCFFSYLVKNL